MPIIDNRKQERTITIKVEKIGYEYDLDRFIDLLLRDIETTCKQREWPDRTQIEMIVE